MVQKLAMGERTGLRVTRRETFIHPRRLSLTNNGSPVEGRGGEGGGGKNEDISDISPGCHVTCIPPSVLSCDLYTSPCAVM